MRKILCSLLALSVVTAALPAQAAGPEAPNTPPRLESKPLAAAIQKAGTDLSAPASKPLVRPQVSAQKVPLSLPRGGSENVRKQGKTGMIIGLVSTIAGVAATVYMVKEMNKDKDNDD